MLFLFGASCPKRLCTVIVFADGYASRDIVVNGSEQLQVSLVRVR
jgi:hypothetical protein